MAIPLQCSFGDSCVCANQQSVHPGELCGLFAFSGLVDESRLPPVSYRPTWLWAKMWWWSALEMASFRYSFYIGASESCTQVLPSIKDWLRQLMKASPSPPHSLCWSGCGLTQTGCVLSTKWNVFSEWVMGQPPGLGPSNGLGHLPVGSRAEFSQQCHLIARGVGLWAESGWGECCWAVTLTPQPGEPCPVWPGCDPDVARASPETCETWNWLLSSSKPRHLLER